MAVPPSALVKVFGTTWCGDCHRAKSLLNQRSVPYEWHDIGSDPQGFEYVLTVNGGRRVVPVLLFPDGSTLVEPSNAQLDRRLRELGYGAPSR